MRADEVQSIINRPNMTITKEGKNVVITLQGITITIQQQ